MLAPLRPALVLLGLLAALTGLAYPLAITGLAQLAAPALANGSLVTRDGAVVGSALIGQNFVSPGYFHGRPSATAEAPYNGANSAGSNLGPTSAKLAGRVKADAAAWGAGSVPADAVTTSASGLDPDISPANAAGQVPRVARARGLAPADVQALVTAETAHPVLGFLGEPRVNVLALNLALDRLQGRSPLATEGALERK